MNAPIRFVLLAFSGATGCVLGIWCASSSPELARVAVAPQPARAFALGSKGERAFEDIAGAVLTATREENHLARCRLLHAALDEVPEAHAVPLLERIDALSETDRDRLLGPVFARLCARFPEAVTPWVLQLPRWRFPEFSGYRIDHAAVFKTWVQLVPETALPIAQQDPLAFGFAFATLSQPGDGVSEPATIGFDSLPPGPLRERAAAIYAAYGYKDVAAAWRIAQTETRGNLRIQAAFTLANNFWHATDPGAVLQMFAELAPELPSGIFGHHMMNDIAARAAGRIEPEEVADWALHLPERLGAPAAIAAATIWAQKAPVEALIWAWNHGVPSDREIDGVHLSGILPAALAVAPDEVSKWLAQLPPTAERERLVSYACADERLDSEQQAALRAALQAEARR